MRILPRYPVGGCRCRVLRLLVNDAVILNSRDKVSFEGRPWCSSGPGKLAGCMGLATVIWCIVLMMHGQLDQYQVPGLHGGLG